jgi:hypothetical protein
MVSISVLNDMRQHYEKNLPKYVKEHKGEYLLLKQGHMGEIIESFYKNKTELESVTERNMNILGPTSLTERIPDRIETFGEEAERHLYEKGLIKKMDGSIRDYLDNLEVKIPADFYLIDKKIK